MNQAQQETFENGTTALNKTAESCCRVAVVGAGVAGLGAAWHLSSQKNFSLTVYEMENLAGGHANTVEVDGTPVDTGFMVFNPRTYPNMISLFEVLGVSNENTEMSFSVSLGNGNLEWSSDDPFVQKFNFLRPSFYGMLADMLRFNKEAPRLLLLENKDPRKSVTLGEYLQAGGYSKSFINHYLLPMAAAVWSAKSKDIMDFPARTFIQFFRNHNMLQVFGRPQWKTVKGRSRQYVNAITNILDDRLHTGVGVTNCLRIQKDGRELFQITDTTSASNQFDQVIFACHPDQVLKILGSSALPIEKEVLSRFYYQDNDVYLHSDPTLMPVRKGAWAAWNYLSTLENSDSVNQPVFITYWLNRLQNLSVERPLLVSLNPDHLPQKETLHKVFSYSHPQFSEGSVQASEDLEKIQGINGTWFCGAYTGYGFHEDGLRSGLHVATALSRTPVPWAGEGELYKGTFNFENTPNFSLVERITNFANITIAKFFSWQIERFLRKSIKTGCLRIQLPNGEFISAGQEGDRTLVLRVFDWNFFIRVGLEYDLGLARSYMAGEWDMDTECPNFEELTDLLIFFCNNRDAPNSSLSVGAFITSWIGYGINFLRYRLGMDNSLSGSLSNISAHYDLSNEMFETFLDKEYMMYSSAIFEAEQSPLPLSTSLIFKDSLESAEIRKLDVLISKCRVEKHHLLLDIGFGWGGLAIRAAETIGCRVHGITLSVEQKKYAEQKVRDKNLDHLISFEVIDYRLLAKKRPGEFDRIISCEMIEAVGHNYLGSYYAAVDRLLKRDGVFVMEAITIPECRYQAYLQSTDFINTIIFPGSCCPSLTALMEAMSRNSGLSLEGCDNICLHYAHTLREWRRRFNEKLPDIRNHGFDSVFARCWNYYLCYCEAGFQTLSIGCMILVFSRPGNYNILPFMTTTYLERLSAATIKD